MLTLKIFSKYGMNLIQSFQLSRCEFESTSVPRPFLFCPLSLHVHVISLSTIHIVLIKLPVSVYSTLLDQVKVWLLILPNDETSAPLWARIPFMRSWASNWFFHVFSSFFEFTGITTKTSNNFSLHWGWNVLKLELNVKVKQRQESPLLRKFRHIK